MKIYARQVEEKYKRSPLFIGDFPDNIAVFGNRDYRKRIPENFQKVINVLNEGELEEIINCIKNGEHGFYTENYETVEQAIYDYLPPEAGTYNIEELKELELLIENYSDNKLCYIMSIVTKNKWNSSMITGSSQREWNYVFYPVGSWCAKNLKAFETMYFNNGREWAVDTGGYFDPNKETPDNITGEYIYCVSYNTEGIKKEIAENCGCNPDDIILYEIKSYRRIPEYVVA